MPNFIWMCSLCRLSVAENHNFGHILKFGGLLYRPTFTDEGQILCAKADRTSTLTCQISSECFHCVGFQWPKATILGKFWLLGAPVPTPYTDEGQIWWAKADRTSTLTCQISSECVHCVAFRWRKTTILGKFWLLGGSCTGSLLPISVKFGVLKQTGRRAKFHLKVFIVSASVAKKTQFWANLDFWGAPVPTP